MNQFQFKTNIKCSGCIAKISPHLDRNKEIAEWKVDTENPDKILTVVTESLNKGEVQQIVENAGFNAETI